MGIEIERKFLVCGEPWQALGIEGTRLTQGYLSTDPKRTVRVRVFGERAYITIKAKIKDSLLARSEYEYEIPLDDAKLILTNLIQTPFIDKIRYRIPHDGMTWDVDVFLGENAGLVLAEIELNSETQDFTKPDWAGCEVTHDVRYLNSHLAESPYSTWVKP